MTMEKILILALAVAFVNQVACKETIDFKPLLTQGIGKPLGDDLNKHMKNIEEKHVPFTKILKEEGCQILTNNKIVSHNVDLRAESCVRLTESIGQLERAILDSYYLAADYANATLFAANNLTHCLESEVLPLILICSLRAVNDYGAQIGQFNDYLRTLLIEEVAVTSQILQFFHECFGEEAPQFEKIARIYANRFCKSREIAY